MQRSDPEKSVDWAAWLASWDRQQEHLLPDREERIAAIFDVIKELDDSGFIDNLYRRQRS